MRKATLTTLLWLLCYGIVKATPCTIPDQIVNGTVIDAGPVMANFNALVTCFANIDNTNIRPGGGIYASQIIPINTTTATFGSSQNYSFNNALSAVGGLVVDSTASPASGIAGGNASTTFLITSNAGASATSGIKFVIPSAVPSAQPQIVVNQQGGNQIWRLTSEGDAVDAGGLAIDGATPDGSSIIGGKSGLPLWFISNAGSGAGANFAFLDGTNAKPAILVDNTSNTVIFEVDGSGNILGLTLGIDTATPPANGIAGGTSSTPLELWSNASAASEAFLLREKGSGNTNLAQLNNAANTDVVTIAENGQITVGPSQNTWISGNNNQLNGTVAVPTVGASNTVCTDGSSNLISCGSVQKVGTFAVTVTTCSTATNCGPYTQTISGLSNSFGCFLSISWAGSPALPISGTGAGTNSLTYDIANFTGGTVSNTGTAYYRCFNP
jgi:hypothetical protein